MCSLRQCIAQKRVGIQPKAEGAGCFEEMPPRDFLHCFDFNIHATITNCRICSIFYRGAEQILRPLEHEQLCMILYAFIFYNLIPIDFTRYVHKDSENYEQSYAAEKKCIVLDLQQYIQESVKN